jgi:hypothetical protein
MIILFSFKTLIRIYYLTIQFLIKGISDEFSYYKLFFLNEKIKQKLTNDKKEIKK